MRTLLLITSSLLFMGCAAMPVNPKVDAKLADLHRRVTFLYELRRDRNLKPERCTAFSGPEMQCRTTDTGACSCVLADDGWGIPKEEPLAEDEGTE